MKAAPESVSLVPMDRKLMICGTVKIRSLVEESSMLKFDVCFLRSLANGLKSCQCMTKVLHLHTVHERLDLQNLKR